MHQNALGAADSFAGGQRFVQLIDQLAGVAGKRGVVHRGTSLQGKQQHEVENVIAELVRTAGQKSEPDSGVPLSGHRQRQTAAETSLRHTVTETLPALLGVRVVDPPRLAVNHCFVNWSVPGFKV